MTHAGRRVLAAGAVALFVAALFASPSQAGTATGVGSAGGSTALAGVDAGDLLKLAVVTERSSASIDPAAGTPTATESISPLEVASQTLPALNDLSVPSVSTTSTGAPDTKSTDAIDLASLPQPVPLLSGQIAPASLSSLVDADGAHASLSSSLANVAVAGGIAKVDSANVDLGGVAGPNQSNSTRSVTVNGVTVLDLRALLQMVGLDLNKLPLQTLADLIQQLGLFDTLNSLTGQNFQSPSDIVNALSSTTITSAQAAVNTAQAALNTAQTTFDQAQAAFNTAQTNLNSANAALATANTALAAAEAAVVGAGLTDALCALPINSALPVCVTLAQAQAAVVSATNAQAAAQAAFNAAQTALNTAQTALDAAKAALDAALAALNSLLGSLSNIFNGLADTLNLQPLLRIEGVQVGSTALAADTVGNSSATTTGSIGNVKVGGINLGGIDLAATLDQINALVGQATTAVNNVLTTISPKLANLVTIQLFKHATDVSQSGSYVNSVAGITGLLATVTPPDVCGVLNDVLTKLPVGLNSLPGVTLPSLPVSSVLSTLGSTINCSVPGILRQQALLPALTTPITLSAAQANSVASFAAAQQQSTTTTTAPSSSTTTTTTTTGSGGSSSNPTGGPTSTGSPLARTGGQNALYLFAGAMLLTVAYFLRRTMETAKAEVRPTTRR